MCQSFRDPNRIRAADNALVRLWKDEHGELRLKSTVLDDVQMTTLIASMYALDCVKPSVEVEYTKDSFMESCSDTCMGCI